MSLIWLGIVGEILNPIILEMRHIAENGQLLYRMCIEVVKASIAPNKSE